MTFLKPVTLAATLPLAGSAPLMAIDCAAYTGNVRRLVVADWHFGSRKVGKVEITAGPSGVGWHARPAWRPTTAML